jgi:hypothetical protein
VRHNVQGLHVHMYFHARLYDGERLVLVDKSVWCVSSVAIRSTDDTVVV